jgi:hypothetical protein
MGFYNPHLFPLAALLSPELTIGLPTQVNGRNRYECPHPSPVFTLQEQNRKALDYRLKCINHNLLEMLDFKLISQKFD